MKIPGSAYLVIGLFVAIASYTIDKQRFFIFLAVGVILAFVGVIKVFSSTVRKRPKARHAAPQHHAQKHPQHHATHYVKFCPSCGQALRISDYFCSRCGTAVRQDRPQLQR